MRLQIVTGEGSYPHNPAMPDNAALEEEFWGFFDRLIAQSEAVSGKPRSSAPPEPSASVDPLDGKGIDLWRGSQPSRGVDALALVVDLLEREVKITLLVGCSEEEQRAARNALNSGQRRACLLRREGELGWLRSRRSVRRFEPRQVPEDLLKKVLKTALWAPSAHNRQPWRFAAACSPPARTELAQAMAEEFRCDLLRDGLSADEVEEQVKRSIDRITGAPAAVVLCLDETQGDQYPDPRRQQAEFLMGVQGVALAGAYLLLAAHAAGLAGVWMCAPLFAQQSVRRALDLPPAWQPQALTLLGYPAKIPQARPRQPIDEVAIIR